jgi:hypothetical protein
MCLYVDDFLWMLTETIIKEDHFGSDGGQAPHA